MIVLDANVLIAFLDGADEHHDRAAGLLEREIADQYAIQSLTLAEVLVAPTRSGTTRVVHRALEELEIREIGFTDDAAARLAALRVETTCRMPDCCVLLAAESNDARIATFDAHLHRAATSRGVDVVGH